MSEFDYKAAEWDSNPMHKRRSEAVAVNIRNMIPLNRNMTALEFGAGTGSTSVFLADNLGEIIMMDNSSAMVEMMQAKIISTGLKNLKAMHFDLEKNDYKEGKFDLVFTQMVLHHVADTSHIISRFASLLNPGGYLAIADLYTEDGSFHGNGFNGHNGFNPSDLALIMKNHGFENPEYRTCFTIEKEVGGDEKRNFDVFIIVSQLNRNKI